MPHEVKPLSHVYLLEHTILRPIVTEVSSSTVIVKQDYIVHLKQRVSLEFHYSIALSYSTLSHTIEETVIFMGYMQKKI